MLDELKRVRKQEHRTRSELMREALRHYFSGRIPEEAPTPPNCARFAEVEPQSLVAIT